MTFDIKLAMERDGGRCQTRDGRKARIVCADAKLSSSETLVVLIDEENGNERLEVYHSDGTFEWDIESHLDLVNLPQETVEYWNVYPPNRGLGCTVWLSPERADEAADPTREFCLRVTKVNGKVTKVELV